MHILPSRSITHDQSSVFFISPSGEVQMSPDNRIKDPSRIGRPGWHMVEAKTAKEKEFYSAKMAEQLWDKQRSFKVQQHIREQSRRNELRASAKIRLAKAPSKLDAMCNESIIRRMDEDDDRFYRMLSEEFSNASRTSGLEEEFHEEATGFFARRGEKQMGIA